MSKAVDEILNSILNDFKAGGQANEAAEAKALYRLLNYCPPISITIASGDPIQCLMPESEVKKDE